MNLNPLLINGLKSLTGFPVVQDIYEGTQDKYITFTYQDERSDFYADNKPISDSCDVYVNLFVPITFDYFEMKDKIRDYLEQQNFSVKIMTWAENGKRETERIRRVVFDCSVSRLRKRG